MAIAIVLVAAAVVLVIVVTSRHKPFGARITAAAKAAMNPGGDVIVHAVSRTTTGTGRFTTRSWWATRPKITLDVVAEGGTKTTIFTTRCGTITYETDGNVFTISPASDSFAPVTDAVMRAADALRRGVLHYRGKVVYHGIAAAELVVSRPGSTITYTVDRRTGFPLHTVNRYGGSIEITSYSVFEHLLTTPDNEQRLVLPRKPGALVQRTAPPGRTPGCSSFGAYLRR